MRKQALIFLFVALVLGFSVPAFSQGATLKGYVKDAEGKPIVGAEVDMVNQDNGQKRSLKTDKQGNIFSIGMPPGTYNVTVTKDGKQIWTVQKFPITLREDTPPLNIDLAKEEKAAASDPKVAEAMAKNEAIKKENEKIGNVNKLLVQATDQMKAQQWDQAVATMQQAVAVDTTHDLVFAKMGEAYLGAKQYPQAADAYSKAIQLKPDAAAYHNNLAQAYAKSNQTDKAIAEYDSAAKLDPTQAGTYYFNEGAVLTNLGKTDDANAAFDKAIAADPNKSDAYYQKGVNLMGKATTGKDGKYIPAPGTVEAFNKYLELDPSGKYAQNAKDMIAALGGTVQTSFSNGKKKSK
ncbi:MAG TPA: tetratricopeptide repeat protein [Candidatus Koribacter sp.]|jgi:tetratricopeptide (TPR) repeat protein